MTSKRYKNLLNNEKQDVEPKVIRDLLPEIKKNCKSIKMVWNV